MQHLYDTNKVGILPYRVTNGVLEFLLHLPKAKKAEEQSDISWGVARGTVRRRDASGEWVDVRDAALLLTLEAHEIEPHHLAAQHEAEEELGIAPDDILAGSWHDHGLLDYASETKGTYPIHFFSFRIADIPVSQLKQQAIDAQNIAWHSLEAAEAMADAGQFKAGYLPILQRVSATIMR